LKTSARRTLARADALYLSTIDDCDAREARARFDEWRAGLSIDLDLKGMPVFTKEEISILIDSLNQSLCAASASLL
jgi:hypothetical protein